MAKYGNYAMNSNVHVIRGQFDAQFSLHNNPHVLHNGYRKHFTATSIVLLVQWIPGRTGKCEVPEFKPGKFFSTFFG